ncbi:substrate-binding periplasmic protein [Rhodoferax aquaticus]|uniref:Transporter substrate-binding domain-containing protein n=1 Tax=Rhodoferax aquaticus TaxID=2527691 RepID=A0A515ET39_9BURK|nr:transporter substrate-binding domain-containing protein [Rhodoferax aquaticus]QDL55846.1 transporter substrate-binding domain-containing protein [Rhodoferax aquaticus]
MTHLVWLVATLCFSLGAVQAQVLAVAPKLPVLVTSADGKTPDGGQAVEILTEAARRAGLTLKMEIQPWSRALLTGSQTANVLLFPVVRTAEREAQFEWLGPVNRVEYWVFRRTEGLAPVAKTLDDLKSASIGTLANNANNEWLKAKLPMATIQPVPLYSSLAPMLFLDRFDYLVAARSTFFAELERLGKPRASVQALFPLVDDVADAKSYVVLAKGSDPQLVRSIRTALERMAADGTWDKMYRKYQ